MTNLHAYLRINGDRGQFMALEQNLQATPSRYLDEHERALQIQVKSLVHSLEVHESGLLLLSTDSPPVPEEEFVSTFNDSWDFGRPCFGNNDSLENGDLLQNAFLILLDNIWFVNNQELVFSF